MFMIQHYKLVEAKPENVRRLARFLNLSTKGEHSELVNRVYVALQRREKSEAEKEAYAKFWEDQSVGVEDLEDLSVGIPR
jgi:hypothetical protein